MLTRTRTEQVSLRMPRDTKRVLQQGAAIAGQSLTYFIVACSTERAQEMLEHGRVITMSQATFDAFVAVLDDPEIRPATSPAAQAIKDYATEIK